MEVRAWVGGDPEEPLTEEILHFRVRGYQDVGLRRQVLLDLEPPPCGHELDEEVDCEVRQVILDWGAPFLEAQCRPNRGRHVIEGADLSLDGADTTAAARLSVGDEIALAVVEGGRLSQWPLMMAALVSERGGGWVPAEEVASTSNRVWCALDLEPRRPGMRVSARKDRFTRENISPTVGQRLLVRLASGAASTDLPKLPRALEDVVRSDANLVLEGTRLMAKAPLRREVRDALVGLDDDHRWRDACLALWLRSIPNQVTAVRIDPSQFPSLVMSERLNGTVKLVDAFRAMVQVAGGQWVRVQAADIGGGVLNARAYLQSDQEMEVVVSDPGSDPPKATIPDLPTPPLHQQVMDALGATDGTPIRGRVIEANDLRARIDLGRGFRATLHRSRLGLHGVARLSEHLVPGQELDVLLELASYERNDRGTWLMLHVGARGFMAEAPIDIERRILPPGLHKGVVERVDERYLLVGIGNRVVKVPSADVGHHGLLDLAGAFRLADEVMVRVGEPRLDEHGNVRRTGQLPDWITEPLDLQARHLLVGTTVEGTAVGSIALGTFVRVGYGVDGLLRGQQLMHGQRVTVTVLGARVHDGKLQLDLATNARD